jgi:hypothetical protein
MTAETTRGNRGVQSAVIDRRYRADRTVASICWGEFAKAAAFGDAALQQT